MNDYTQLRHDLAKLRSTAQDVTDQCRDQRDKRGPALHTWEERHQVMRRIAAELRRCETELARIFA